MKQGRYKALAHRAGCIRKKYRLTPVEAAWCTLWLAGAKEADIPRLAAEMDGLRQEKEVKKHGKRS